MRSRRVRRRAISCARCRTRKMMCDGASPSCSSCSEAKVPCLAWNSATNATAPRSIVQYLEQRIAILGRKGNDGERGEDGMKINPTTAPARHPAVSEVLKDMTPDFLGLMGDGVLLPGCVDSLIPTQVPTVQMAAFHNMSDLHRSHPRTILNQQETSPPPLSPESVPINVIDFLQATYLTRILHQFPMFRPDQVEHAFQPDVYRENPRAMYITSLVMAISLLTAARDGLARAQSLSFSLFRNAMRHVPAVLTNDISGLQAMLLLIQYNIQNPNVANLWLLTGMASEACIDLGLHHEASHYKGCSATESFLEREQRCRVFWVVFDMEIAVSAGFRRPIRILNQHINVSFPANSGPTASTLPSSTSTSLPSETLASSLRPIPIFMWRFRVIESSIISILHHNDEPLPVGVSLEDWIASTEAELSSWASEVRQGKTNNLDSAIQPQWDDLMGYAKVAVAYGLVVLYGPLNNNYKNTSGTENNPRNTTRRRCPINLMKAFSASATVATAYLEQLQGSFGAIKYAFNTCYHGFTAAIVFLQILQDNKSEVAAQYTLLEVEELAHCFVRLFAASSERWPAARRCLEQFSRLLHPVMTAYSEFLLQSRGPRHVGWNNDDGSGGIGEGNGLFPAPVPPLPPLMPASEEQASLTEHTAAATDSISASVPVDTMTTIQNGNPNPNPGLVLPGTMTNFFMPTDEDFFLGFSEIAPFDWDTEFQFDRDHIL